MAEKLALLLQGIRVNDGNCRENGRYKRRIRNNVKIKRQIQLPPF